MGTRVRRLGLIGDVHAEHRRLSAALEHLIGAGVDALCCTGDVVDGTGDVDVCCKLLAAANVINVAGNHDRWLLADRMRNVPYAHCRSDLTPFSCDYLESLPSTRTIETTLGDALLCHGVGANDMRKVWPGSARMPIERSPELDSLIELDDTRFVFNGHLHYRVIVNFERLTLLNAGTLKGEHRPGVSLLDFDAQTVSAFEFTDDFRLLRVAERPMCDDTRRIWRDTQEFDCTWTPVALYAA
ncbi:MAG TPA: metallophosphoesterase family protein [Pseudomonadales bacterium]|nr:metallophosphoesterase family protein [Pseudomonadales bacterium]